MKLYTQNRQMLDAICARDNNWNISAQLVFNCCWRERTASLQFYCKCQPMSHIIDQQIFVS